MTQLKKTIMGRTCQEEQRPRVRGRRVAGDQAGPRSPQTAKALPPHGIREKLWIQYLKSHMGPR